MKGCFLTSTQSADSKAVSKLNLAATPNEWKVNVTTPETNSVSSSSVLLASMQAKLSKVGRHGNARQEATKKWFEMPKAQVTPEVKAELTALRLKGYMDPKKFYKTSDLTKVPERFQFGVMVEGGLRAVGGGQESQAAGTANRSAAKGRTLLQEALGDDGVQAWTQKRFRTVHSRQMKTAAFAKKIHGKTKRTGNKGK